jgi:hypothetical protein
MQEFQEKLDRFKSYNIKEKCGYIYRLFLRKFKRVYKAICKRLRRIYEKTLYSNIVLPTLYVINNKKLAKKDKEIDFEVDAVYMWVDGDDPKIREKRLKYLGIQKEKLNVQSAAKGRYYDNDELKYSFRSLEKYAPWIRKIFLITDDQVPKWFKDNSKVEIVDHKDIMDKKYLPTFNSEVIDFNIHKIKGLADRFLLINDDMFFGRQVYKSFFFTKKGIPIKYLRGIRRKWLSRPSSGMFYDIYKRCQRLIEEKFGEIPTTRFDHCITAYQKDSFPKTIELFRDEVERTLTSRFRKEYDVARFLVDFYEIAVLGAKIKNVYKRRNFYNIVVDLREDTLYKLSMIEKRRPYMFCLNDTEKTTDKDREICGEFLEEVLSEKSSFEK